MQNTISGIIEEVTLTDDKSTQLIKVKEPVTVGLEVVKENLYLVKAYKHDNTYKAGQKGFFNVTVTCREVEATKGKTVKKFWNTDIFLRSFKELK